MKKILLLMFLLVSYSMAELTQAWADKSFVTKKIKIIDIRTPGEWKETGMVKGSYPIMFFDEKGNVNIQKFLKDLNKVVKKDESFALICRVGSRTKIVSEYLSEKLGYKVINLKGGIMRMLRQGYRTVPYRNK